MYELKVVGDPTSPKTLYFGYPNCFTVWDPTPFTPPLSTGDRWTSSPNSTFNDTTCNTKSVHARLSFMAHSAPLDIKFYYPQICSNSSGANEWGSFPCSWNGSAIVSFHGSWNRDPPTGYKVVYVPWDPNSNQPVAPDNCTTGYENLLYTQKVEAGDNNCPNGCTRYIYSMFSLMRRPVGLAFDTQGRLYISSDATGEIFRVRYTNSSTGPSSTSSATLNSLSAIILAFILVLISTALD